MKGFEIVEILKVVLKDILLELHFNIQFGGEKRSFSLCISDDGETVLIDQIEGWRKLTELDYELYRVESAEDDGSLVRLLKDRIVSIRFALGSTLDMQSEVIYYVKIDTEKSKFLFYNNGDRGAYAFDKIDEIMKNDIYGYKWIEQLSGRHQG